jgi:hypothetical protein
MTKWEKKAEQRMWKNKKMVATTYMNRLRNEKKEFLGEFEFSDAFGEREVDFVEPELDRGNAGLQGRMVEDDWGKEHELPAPR